MSCEEADDDDNHNSWMIVILSACFCQQVMKYEITSMTPHLISKKLRTHKTISNLDFISLSLSLYYTQSSCIMYPYTYTFTFKKDTS